MSFINKLRYKIYQNIFTQNMERDLSKLHGFSDQQIGN